MPQRLNSVGANIPPELQDALAGLLKPGMRTLEAGSGLSTQYFTEARCDHTALENELEYAPDLPCIVIAPLIGKPPWYDWQPDGPYDVLLIDGPDGRLGRQGIMRVFELLVHDETVVLLDNSDRRDECQLIQSIRAVWPCGVIRVKCGYGGEYATLRRAVDR